MTTSHSWHQPLRSVFSAMQAEHLDREARLAEDLTADSLDRAARALGPLPVQTIVDLGAGTGAGSLALARRFPDASVHSIELSPELVQQIAVNAEAAGLDSRVIPHEADLDEDWSSQVPAEAELVWASLSLHHVADPAAVLRRAFSVLRPGGVIVVTEMDGSVSLTPDDLGVGHDGVADRLAAHLSDIGHPTTADWTSVLGDSGFGSIVQLSAEVAADGRTPDGAAYLASQVAAWRTHLATRLSSGDAAALALLERELHTGSSSAVASSGRAVWVAARPASIDGGIAQTLDADVVVVGGGAAGLAAAIALGRSRRDVIVIDAGEPRNAPADGVHNILGSEGIPPGELLAKGRAEAAAYGVRVIPGRATAASGAIDGFTVSVDGGAARVNARRIILATGLVDDLPDVPGVREGWGHSVLHCPFCHGWEVRDKRIGILTRDSVAVHHALLFRELSDDVTLFLHDAADPTEEQQAQLDALGVSVLRPRVERLIMDGAQVRAIQVAGGAAYDVDAVIVAPRFDARTELYEGLGGESEQTPFGRQIPVGPRGDTPVGGVYAAGNAGDPMAMVGASMASGVTTGSAVHGDLAFADLTRVVRARSAEQGDDDEDRRSGGGA